MKTIVLKDYAEFKALLGEAKQNSDPIFCRLIFRPLSFPTGWILYKFGIKANSISLISILFTLISSSVLVLGSMNDAVFVSLLMLTVSLLDCIDGNIARARHETGPGGEWMDALGGYTVYALIPIALGIHIYLHYPNTYWPELWIIVGALTSVSNLFLRLIYQKFLSAKIDEHSQKNIKGSDSLFSKFSGEMGLVGWMMPSLLIASVMNMLEIYLALYCFFYMTSAVIITYVLARKVTSI